MYFPHSCSITKIPPIRRKLYIKEENNERMYSSHVFSYRPRHRTKPPLKLIYLRSDDSGMRETVTFWLICFSVSGLVYYFHLETGCWTSLIVSFGWVLRLLIETLLTGLYWSWTNYWLLKVLNTGVKVKSWSFPFSLSMGIG